MVKSGSNLNLAIPKGNGDQKKVGAQKWHGRRRRPTIADRAAMSLVSCELGGLDYMSVGIALHRLGAAIRRAAHGLKPPPVH